MMTPAAPVSSMARMSSRTPTPPDAMTPAVFSRATIAVRAGRFGPLNVPSRRISVKMTVRNPWASRPTAARSAATSDWSQAASDACAPARQDWSDGFGGLHDRGAEHRPIDAEREDPVDMLEGTQAASELDRDSHPGPDAGDGVAVDGLTLDGAVQIDDVNPFGAGIGPTRRCLSGIGIEGRFASEITFDEAATPPAPDVDRGVDDHPDALAEVASGAARLAPDRVTSTKRLTRSRPSSPLFSGWNWVPQTLPWTTTLGKRSP